jgi:Uma2 family endonuclease
MQAAQIPSYTVAEYLQLERDSDIRHEYLNGEILAMGGASEAHNMIAGNLYVAIHSHLRNTPCRVFMNDMKIYVKSANHFFYPDLMVACGESPEPQNRYHRDDAKLLIEVLSKSTATRDREYKRIIYKQLPSLQEYALFAQGTEQVTVYRRQPKGWQVETYEAGETVNFESIGLSVPMALVYEGLDTGKRSG